MSGQEDTVPKPQPLSTSEWVDQVADHFEKAWKEGRAPKIGDYLGESSGERRQVLLRELVKLDLDYRWNSADPRMLEDYLKEFPEILGPDNACPEDLLLYWQRLLDRFDRGGGGQSPKTAVGDTEGITPRAVPIRCPHCATRTEVVEGTEEIVCANCGGRFRVVSGSSAPGQLAEVPRQIGRFQVIELIGQGAFGSVYKARDEGLHRLVAIKVPRAGTFTTRADEDRFLREARSAAQLKHPNIVQVHEIANEQGVPYIVSDYIEGMTLADFLTGRKPTYQETAELVARIAFALDYAHRRKIIHRDIKPSNILMDPTGQPLLTDFGLARREESEVTVTLDGQILGTPAYMSPEQAAGSISKVDARSDVYSLGVVLYELLTGELPFRGNTRVLLHQVLHEEPRPPRTLNDRIPKDLEIICLKAMAKSAAARYSTALEFGDDLRRFLGRVPIRARPVGPFERVFHWFRRHPAPVSAATILLFAVCCGLWLNHAIRVEEQVKHLSVLIEKLSADEYYQSAADFLDQLRSLEPGETLIRKLETRLYGEVSLQSQPEGAQVTLKYWDDRSDREPLTVSHVPAQGLLGTTPLPKLKLLAGEYVLHTHKDGCVSLRSSFPLKPGESRALKLVLQEGQELPESLSLEEGRAVRLKDSAEMVYVPPGEFLMGSDRDDPEALPHEMPLHPVSLPGYWIDAHEVTVGQFQKFVEAANYPFNPFSEDWKADWERAGYGRAEIPRMPMVNVSWFDALAYANWLETGDWRTGCCLLDLNGTEDALSESQRKWKLTLQPRQGFALPTEAEWEKAARGADQRRYPWGDRFHPKRCNSAGHSDGFDSIAAAGQFPQGISPFGAMDLSGNVSEWVFDAYDRDFYFKSLRETPLAHETSLASRRVLRGGNWCDYPQVTRAAHRLPREPSDRTFDAGFRIVLLPRRPHPEFAEEKWLGADPESSGPEGVNSSLPAQKEFHASMRMGLKLEGEHRWSDAAAEYSRAAAISQQAGLDARLDADVQSRLTNAREMEAQTREFEALMQKGNEFLAAKNFPEAIASFQSAEALARDKRLQPARLRKAAESLEKAQVEAAAAADKQRETEAWLATLKAGDEHLASKRWKEAEMAYESALRSAAEKQLPKELLSNAQSKLNHMREVQKADAEFRRLLQEGDDLLNQKRLQPAAESYLAAQKLAQQKLAGSSEFDHARERLAQARLAQYQEQMERGRKLMAEQRWKEAAQTFLEAEKIPESLLDKNLILQASQERGHAEKMDLADKDFTATMAEGRKREEAQQWPMARRSYLTALRVASLASLPARLINEAKSKVTGTFLQSPPDLLYKQAEFGPEEAAHRQWETAEALGLLTRITLDLGRDATMHFVLIPSGEFFMGSNVSDKGRDKDEGPPDGSKVIVRITRPFYLGETEVTQGQWQALMGSNPCEHRLGNNHPVESVTWTECQEFLLKLNQLGQGRFRFPTEAEWEAACRAGSTRQYWFGDRTPSVKGLDPYLWFSYNSDSIAISRPDESRDPENPIKGIGRQDAKHHPVSTRLPNPWGLYDMHGNVFEWCQDWYDKDYYVQIKTDDPCVNTMGRSNQKTIRGGAAGCNLWWCRSAERHGANPDESYQDVGFRALMELSQLSK